MPDQPIPVKYDLPVDCTCEVSGDSLWTDPDCPEHGDGSEPCWQCEGTGTMVEGYEPEPGHVVRDYSECDRCEGTGRTPL